MSPEGTLYVGVPQFYPDPARTVISGWRVPGLGDAPVPNYLIGFEGESPKPTFEGTPHDLETELVVRPDRAVLPVGIHMCAPDGVSIMNATIGDVPLVRGPVQASVWNGILHRVLAEGGGYPCVAMPGLPVLDRSTPLEITLRWRRRPGRAWSHLDAVTGYVVVVPNQAYPFPAQDRPV